MGVQAPRGQWGAGGRGGVGVARADRARAGEFRRALQTEARWSRAAPGAGERGAAAAGARARAALPPLPSLPPFRGRGAPARAVASAGVPPPGRCEGPP